MRVLVSGANGFIGKNLTVHLNEQNIDYLTFNRENSVSNLYNLISESDFIVHLAGENRPEDEEDFNLVNANLTASICEVAESMGKKIPIIFASSTQASLSNAYGKSKLEAEIILKKFEKNTGSPIYIYRLPGVFGKWCKPNYNSVVATFCHNISHNLPIQIDNPDHELTLVYIDDVIKEFIGIIKKRKINKKVFSINPEYKIKLGKLATQIEHFRDSRSTLISENVGKGFVRKLYSTYVSYLSTIHFAYPLPAYNDERGLFAEILKTKESGQFSFFTAKPGVVRGGHYHHTKTEKFLVVHGEAKFGFRNIISGKTFDILVTSDKLEIIETIPGWSHNITNVGDTKMVVMLWANEIFDPNNPDTIKSKV
jgi:UDP-2-acetamido-2,6-beta-L-arabino-hexul-4-ose reductase